MKEMPEETSSWIFLSLSETTAAAVAEGGLRLRREGSSDAMGGGGFGGCGCGGCVVRHNLGGDQDVDRCPVSKLRTGPRRSGASTRGPPRIALPTGLFWVSNSSRSRSSGQRMSSSPVITGRACRLAVSTRI